MMNDKPYVNHTDVVGSFSMDPNTDFKSEVASVTESMMHTTGMDVVRDFSTVLQNTQVRNQYKEALFESTNGESAFIDNEIQQHIPSKLEQLFENTAEEVLMESYSGQLLPIVGYTMPILKKSFLKSASKDMILTEVPQQPIVKVAFERKFLKDIDGNKHYIPDIFYDQSYKEIMEHAQGKQIPKKWYPESASGSIQINELNLLQEAGGSIQTRDTISPNFQIVGVKMDVSGEEVEINGLNIHPERSQNGAFSVSVKGRTAAGDQVEDIVTGKLDYYTGTISVACTAGLIKQVMFDGRLSNQNNTQTVELDMERESITWEIPHGPHINTGMTIENIKDMKALNNIDVGAQAISDMADTYNQYEDSSIIDYILSSFDRWHDQTDFPFGFKDGFTELYTFDALQPQTTVLPQSAWVHDVKYSLNREMDSLKEKLKTEELMFIIIGNPAHITLLSDSIEWVFQSGKTVANVKMEYDYGVLTKSGSRANVVSSMKIPRSAGLHVLAYATTANNITRKHYKYSQAIRNDYLNPLANLTPNIMAETRFLTTEVTPVHGKMIIENAEFGRLTKTR